MLVKGNKNMSIKKMGNNLYVAQGFVSMLVHFVGYSPRNNFRYFFSVKGMTQTEALKNFFIEVAIKKSQLAWVK